MNVKTTTQLMILVFITMAGHSLGQELTSSSPATGQAVELAVKEFKKELVSSIKANDVSRSRELIDQILAETDVDLSASILDANTNSRDRETAAKAASYAVEFKKLRRAFANLKTIDSGTRVLTQNVFETTGLTNNGGGGAGGYGGGYGGGGGGYGGDGYGGGGGYGGGYGGGGYGGGYGGGGYGGGDGGYGGAAQATKTSELKILRKQLAQASDKEQEKIARAIRKIITEEFETESQKRKQQLSKLEKRLDDLRNQLQRRNDSREDLIEIRVKTLLLEARGLMVEKVAPNVSEGDDDPFSDY